MLSQYSKIVQRLFTLKKGQARRIVFYYDGEEPTFLENVDVVIFKNGMIDISYRSETLSTHIQNVEIVWTANNPVSVISSRPLSLVKDEPAN